MVFMQNDSLGVAIEAAQDAQLVGSSMRAEYLGNGSRAIGQPDDAAEAEKDESISSPC